MNIAALISGGVDSAVVVHLLCEQGYKPDLFYIKIGMDGDEDLTCTAEEDIELCTATARKYGLSLNIIDLHRQYWDNVVAYAIDKVKRGLTPNPDVMCNKLIKFGCLSRKQGIYMTRQLPDITPVFLKKTGKYGWEPHKTRQGPNRFPGTNRLSANFKTDVPFGRSDEE